MLTSVCVRVCVAVHQAVLSRISLSNQPKPAHASSLSLLLVSGVRLVS